MIGENQPQEIIIIKRGSEGEEGHHGGAWKIAFADFMTAMMALFLVLWLVNAANEETKKAVASYFNPVKLVDRNQSKKGVDEQTGGPSQGEEGGGSASAPLEKPAKPEAIKEVTGAKGTFFEDPFTALEEIADAEVKKQSAGKQGGGDNNSKLEGEADPFPDPFDPEPVPAAPEVVEVEAPTRAGAQAKPGPEVELPTKSAKPVDAAELSKMVEADSGAVETVNPLLEKAAPTQTIGAKEQAKSQSGVEVAPAEHEGKTAEREKEKRAQKIEALSKEILEDIQTEIALVFDDAKAMNSALSVKAVEDGVLISVTDVLDYSMFEIGSAVPRGQIVLAMEKIGQVVAKQSGPLRIYGHTDARQYKAGSGDNWQLSSQRALAAYYMLGRAGLNAQRVTQVTGFADRELREAASPNADVNRRIELLLEVK